MNNSTSNGTELAIKPPSSIAYKTLKNFLEIFKDKEIPSHIDRSVLPPSMSGGNQAYLVSALKFLKLISENNVPEENFHLLVKAEGAERTKILREVLTSAYPFLLNDKDLDIERTTTRVVSDKFKETGISGDTVRKALTFFLNAAKDAEMKVSSHIKTQFSSGKSTRTRKAATKTENDVHEDKPEREEPLVEKKSPPKSPYQVLIEILSPDMEEEEQTAVWTLIRYLKKQEAAAEE